MIVGTRCFLYAYKKSDFENQFDSVGTTGKNGFESHRPHILKFNFQKVYRYDGRRINKYS